jgi:hypothetical protein
LNKTNGNRILNECHLNTIEYLLNAGPTGMNRSFEFQEREGYRFRAPRSGFMFNSRDRIYSGNKDNNILPEAGTSLLISYYSIVKVPKMDLILQKCKFYFQGSSGQGKDELAESPGTSTSTDKEAATGLFIIYGLVVNLQNFIYFTPRQRIIAHLF